MFIFFLLIGRFAEMRARHKTEAATHAMAALLPDTTFRLTDQQLTEISLDDIQVNDILVIKPGQANLSMVYGILPVTVVHLVPCTSGAVVFQVK